MYSIRRCFDRYTRLPYWVVSGGLHQSAHFPAAVYGAARAELLARSFVAQLRSGAEWRTALSDLPRS